MKVVFWLLDASYDVVEGVPEIRLWGITPGGDKIVVLDQSFRPYFYVLPRGDPQKVLEGIMKHKTRYKILGADIIEKKYFGRPVKAIKVTLSSPRDVPRLREELADMPGVKEVLEADIRFYVRYMIDNEVHPCGWHEVEAEKIDNTKGWRVEAVYLARGRPKYLGADNPPPLEVYAFDIECYNSLGEPRPKRDPVIIIARKTSREGVKIFEAIDGNDKDLLKMFVKDLLSLDPDVVVGYNSNGFDWPYLLARARINRVRLDVSRGGGEPAPSVYGHYSVVGRANIDLYDFAEEVYEVKVKTLENIADYLGVKKKSERVLIDASNVYKYWDNPSKRPLLIEYAKDDVESTYGLAEKFLPFAIHLSNIVGLTLDQVGAASVGYRVEWYLIREAYKSNELVPNRTERSYETYKGGMVLKPRPGLHENIAVLDFSSMYPNIMVKYNVSPDTYVPPGEPVDPDEVYVAPEVGHRFRKTPTGFYKRVIEKLLAARRGIREEMKKYPPGSYQYRLLDERQRAIKVIANATYGYCGWVGARWYRREVAEATTAWGRMIIRETINMAKSLGLQVIYGDTDSIFVKYEPKKVERLIQAVNEKFQLEIKIDKLYKKIFFTEAKKRYCGVLEDGRIDVVGLEAVRGDWAEIAKEVQEHVIEIVLREGDIDKAVEYVRGIIRKLEEGQIPIEKLVIWKTIGKSLEDYEMDTAHVAAARKLVEAGYTISKGEKIGFVILKGDGRLSDKTMPYILVKDPSEIDYEYYVEKQVIPAALRILGYFGIREQQLRKGGQRTLLDFFG